MAVWNQPRIEGWRATLISLTERRGAGRLGRDVRFAWTAMRTPFFSDADEVDGMTREEAVRLTLETGLGWKVLRRLLEG